MGKSLKDLFEVSEVLDPKQEVIAKILLNTSDQDNNPADKPFQELAKKLEMGDLSVEQALEALDAMTKEDMQEDTRVVPKGSSDRAKLKTDIKKDATLSTAEKAEMIDAVDSTPAGTTDTIRTVDEVVDEEGRMAKSELLKLTQYSAKLYKALADDDQLPAWIQAKITLAADYIGTVKHYLEGEQAMGGEEAPTGQLEEAAGDVEYYNWEDLHLPIFTNKPVEEISDDIYLPLGSDARKMLSTRNYKKMLELPEDYQSKYGTKEELVKREYEYLERDFYQWKEGFEGIEGDEEVKVTCTHTSCVVEVEAIKKMADKYAAGKAKGDTSDVYESSLLKIFSK